MCIIHLRLFHQYVIVHVDLFVIPAAILFITLGNRGRTVAR